MNYVWEALLSAQNTGFTESALRFVTAENPSPYVEVSFQELNTTQLEKAEVSVNPLYRFGEIFAQMLAPDVWGYEAARQIFLDVVLHYMANTDLLSGMHKQEYYFWFLKKELQAGSYGRKAAEAMKLFSNREQRLIITALLGLYRSSHGRESFIHLIQALYEYAIIYADQDRASTIFLYVGRLDTGEERQRIQFLIDTFLQIGEEVRVFYERHFGILDVEETMQIDRILLI